MDPNLKIDDDYVKTIGRICELRGLALDTNYGNSETCILSNYIRILQSIRDEAICKGEIAEALNVYISSAIRLKGKLKDISADIKKVCDAFIIDIDKADQYIF